MRGNQQQIEWRRNQVMKLTSDELTEREIASKLQVSKTLVHKDLVLLRQNIDSEYRNYVKVQAPFEYKKSIVAMNEVIKYMSAVMSDDSKEPKERMQAANIKMQAINIKMELVFGAHLVPQASDLIEKVQGFDRAK